MGIKRELSKLNKLGDLPAQWKWLRKDIEQRKSIVENVLKELSKLHSRDDKVVHAKAEVKRIKEMLEAMLAKNDPSQTEQSRLASELNHEVSAIHYIDHLDDLRPSLWRRFTRRATQPMRVAAAGAMLASAQPAIAQTNQQTPEPQRQGIEQANQYPTSRIKLLPAKIKLESGLQEDAYRKAVDEYIRKNNLGIDTTSDAYQRTIDSIAKRVFAKRGRLWPSDFNKNVNEFNDYQEIARFIDATSLDSKYKGSLKDFYLDLALAGKLDINHSKESISKTPKNARIVKIKPGQNLRSVLLPFFPSLDYLSEAKKKELYDLVTEINPYVKMIGSVDLSNKMAQGIIGDQSGKAFVLLKEGSKTIKYIYDVSPNVYLAIPK